MNSFISTANWLLALLFFLSYFEWQFCLSAFTGLIHEITTIIWVERSYKNDKLLCILSLGWQPQLLILLSVQREPSLYGIPVENNVTNLRIRFFILKKVIFRREWIQLGYVFVHRYLIISGLWIVDGNMVKVWGIVICFGVLCCILMHHYYYLYFNQNSLHIILHSNITNTARPQGFRDSRANTDESRIFFMYIK